MKGKRFTGIMLAAMMGAAGVVSGTALTQTGFESEAYAAGDVAINAKNFPDENFRKYISENIDKDGDGKLNEEEISGCKVIDLYRRYNDAVHDLKGIEYFTALEALYCSDQKIESLDLSKNINLRSLRCGVDDVDSYYDGNLGFLKKLNISNNVKLEILYCNYNHLESLDVSKNTALKRLLCANNNLSSLDVSKNTALEVLECFSNNLSSLDVSRNTALEELECSHNNLNSLDVSKNAALEHLDCNNNELSSLDVSKNTTLEWLYCDSNNLSSIDVSKNASLKGLDCKENNLSSLDMSQNTALYSLHCHSQVKQIKCLNGEIPLSAIDPALNPANITNLNGAVISGDKLTNITGDTVTYDYKTGYTDRHYMDVTLKVVKTIAPEKVTLDKTLYVLDKGKTGKLTATVTPDNADDKIVTWTSSAPSVATVDVSGNIKAINPGKATITAKTSNGKTAVCEVTVNEPFTGVKEDAGRLNRFKSGAVDTSYTGLDKYSKDGKWYYFVKGVHAPSCTGIAQRTDGKLVYVKNGIHDNTFTGVAQNSDGKWMFVRNGEFDPTYTGVARNTSGKWVFVKNGRYYAKYTGVAKNTDDKWVFVKKGAFNTSFTGVARNTSGSWVFVKKGRYYAKYTGVAKSISGNRVYVIKGKYSDKAKKSTGVAKSTSGKYVFVRKGRFDPAHTGLAKSLKTGKLVYVTKGYLNTKYNGKAKYKGKIYTVKKGVAQM